MTNTVCNCGSQLNYNDCCGIYIDGNQKPPTALALMKSRYTAYARHQGLYLLNTTHISERHYYTEKEILNWATSNKWQKLEIISATENTVAFKAFYLDQNNEEQVHYELSRFKKENGNWYYVDGKFK
jgi:SEC-C motif-containing protein